MLYYRFQTEILLQELDIHMTVSGKKSGHLMVAFLTESRSKGINASHRARISK